MDGPCLAFDSGDLRKDLCEFALPAHTELSILQETLTELFMKPLHVLVCCFALLAATACHPFEDTSEPNFDATSLDDTANQDGNSDLEVSVLDVDLLDAETEPLDTDAELDIDVPPDLDVLVEEVDLVETADVVADAEADAAFVCSDDASCLALGDPPCGLWLCDQGTCKPSCSDCTDVDNDGYGPEATCAGPDCDDTDSSVGSDVPMTTCYGGPSGTEGNGSCRAGQHACDQGVWTACVGEVLPGLEVCDNEDNDCNGTPDDLGVAVCGFAACTRSVPICTSGVLNACTGNSASTVDDTTCDNIDDDCDGLIDEDCFADCVWVVPYPTGNPDGSKTNPFGSVQAAIDEAAERLVGAAATAKVCVASNWACSTVGGSPYDGPITMADGVSVFGSFNATGWARCPGITTTLNPGTHTGVSFSDITQPTTLDGFKIVRADQVTTVAGVTLTNSINVTLSHLDISDTTPAQFSYGIDMKAGSEALITESAIQGGNGSVETIGVRSVNSKPTIKGNCGPPDGQGRCTECGDNALPLSPRIRGGANAVGSALNVSVWLEDSPGAEVDGNALCTGGGGEVFGVKLLGNAQNTRISRNVVFAGQGTSRSAAVFSEGCWGDQPWITNNTNLVGAGSSTGTSFGIFMAGDCHPTIDRNVHIGAGGEGAAPLQAYGIYCGNLGGASSACSILDNPDIQGSNNSNLSPTLAVGVECADGGCNLVHNNTISGAPKASKAYGMRLEKSGGRIDANKITAGCGASESLGVSAQNAYARLENNVITGGACANTGPTGASVGLFAVLQDGPNELDVHSNLIDGGGTATLCSGAALVLTTDATRPPLSNQGTFRNNIFRAGPCVTYTIGVLEESPLADPRTFENNAFDNFNSLDLYFDADNGVKLQLVDEVNLLPDMKTGGNVTGSPAYMGYPSDVHILPNTSSICENTGTPAGGPPFDMEGDTRDSTTPDIGPDEF
ncbi:MAG: hypothetical protein CO108_31335 [Deltaproteobacteria bacterium CG_4_9_14_3_um_filter_63_12]|nr:MAG: hypothetical protein CO108_31335 [Deltaproteobacteria bacterium CG_4_9_14_3_um_filter_63_12]